MISRSAAYHSGYTGAESTISLCGPNAQAWWMSPMDGVYRLAREWAILLRQHSSHSDGKVSRSFCSQPRTPIAAHGTSKVLSSDLEREAGNIA
jgi:hypothetical protein